MVIPKRNFDENRRIYFLIKKEKVFIKYMEIYNISNIIKSKFDGELLYSNKYLKTGKIINTKGSFQCLYALIILID